jgi:ABC-type phosphate/phosphonate transport system substrate-binding protein
MYSRTAGFAAATLKTAVLKLFLPFVITLITCTTVSAQIIFTAPPREDLESGVELYAPLTERLSQLLGDEVIYEHPSGWFEYVTNMRKGKYDIVFDGPHFAAWRVKHLEHIPIVALPGQLNFTLIAKKSNKEVKQLRDLAARKVCGLLSPNLGTSLIYDVFKDPMMQPVIYEVKGGTENVYQAFKNDECEAAILRDTEYSELPNADKAELVVLVNTRSLPNQTITISKRLKKNAKKLTEFMLSKEGVQSAEPLLERFSKKEKYFLQTSAENYAGMEGILEGVVFGW